VKTLSDGLAARPAGKKQRKTAFFRAFLFTSAFFFRMIDTNSGSYSRERVLPKLFQLGRI
jgi:hypothetical protein